MRVLIVGPLPPPNGGIASWMSNLMDESRLSNLHFDVLNTAHDSFDGNKIRRLLNNYIKYRLILKGLKNYNLNNEYDVYHINTSCNNRSLFLCNKIIQRCKGKKIVLHCHCNISDQLTKYGTKIFNKILKRISKIIVLNKASMDYIVNLGYKNVSILPNFVKEEYVVNEKIISNKLKKVIYVGHVVKTKGIDEILKISGIFTNLSFELYGAIGSEYKNFKVPNNVTFFGNVEASLIREKLLNSDLFIFPSHTEGFSVALLEAMACGLPCIATNVGANKDMLEDAGGKIVKVSDVYSLVEAIEYYNNFDNRLNASKRNIAKVSKNYTSKTVIKALENIYNS